MKTWIFEATQPGHGNWGKFLVGQMDEREWTWPSQVPGNPTPGVPVLKLRHKWSRAHLWIKDLETGEGALFRPGGYAKADLNQRRIWVCPMFEPFLVWLYEQLRAGKTLDELPKGVEIEADFDWAGYRRPGPVEVAREHVRGQLGSVKDVAKLTGFSAQKVWGQVRTGKGLGELVVDVVDGRPLFWLPDVERLSRHLGASPTE